MMNKLLDIIIILKILPLEPLNTYTNTVCNFSFVLEVAEKMSPSFFFFCHHHHPTLFFLLPFIISSSLRLHHYLHSHQVLFASHFVFFLSSSFLPPFLPSSNFPSFLIALSSLSDHLPLIHLFVYIFC